MPLPSSVSQPCQNPPSLREHLFPKTHLNEFVKMFTAETHNTSAVQPICKKKTGPTVVRCFPQVQVSQRIYSSRTCGTNANIRRKHVGSFLFNHTRTEKRTHNTLRGQRHMHLTCTSLFSKQWTMKRKVPCWELRMMKSTWKKRLVWYRPRIQVQPSMTNWATILNKITLQKK